MNGTVTGPGPSMTVKVYFNHNDTISLIPGIMLRPYVDPLSCGVKVIPLSGVVFVMFLRQNM